MILNNIHNHYEKLVFDEIQKYQKEKDKSYDEGILEDVACLALNHLPARYVRYSVDIAFYLTSKEHADMNQDVLDAVKAAFDLVMLPPSRS